MAASIGFGIATIGLLAGAAFVGKADSHESDLLIIFVLLVAYLAVTIWFFEVMRMLRASAFVLRLEKMLVARRASKSQRSTSCRPPSTARKRRRTST